MRPSLFFVALAAANGHGVAATRIPNNYINNGVEVFSYLSRLVPVAMDVMSNQLAGPSIGADVNFPLFFLLSTIILFAAGVAIAVLPEEGRPDYFIYWLRDACLAYHAWLVELEIAGNADVALRALVDDFVLP